MSVIFIRPAATVVTNMNIDGAAYYDSGRGFSAAPSWIGQLYEFLKDIAAHELSPRAFTTTSANPVATPDTLPTFFLISRVSDSPGCGREVMAEEDIFIGGMVIAAVLECMSGRRYSVIEDEEADYE